jgi:tRNA threonylcarbamoyladenosine biosynthesis protein TsaE
VSHLALRTNSVDATRALGEALAEIVRGGDLLVLAGDLGAGKTALTQGIGRGLGVADAITRPTFTLAHQHQGRIRLHHLDVYRFEASAEILDVGLFELLDDDEGVTVIEWGDAILGSLPPELLEVRLELGDGDDDRDIALHLAGERWLARRRALGAALSPWVVPDEATA